MRVFVSGSFDMLHSGHVTFLKRAAEYGDLYVGIGSDCSIAKYKGRAPVCPEAERLFMVGAIRWVRGVWVNAGEGPNDFFTMDFQPDAIVVNEDQHTAEKELFCWTLGIEYVILKRTQEVGLPVRSTTKLRC